MSRFRLCAPFEDGSGYGEFARYFAYVLSSFGQSVLCKNITLPSSVKSSTQLGHKHSLVKTMYSNNVDADINIIFMVPQLFSSNKIKNGLNIGFTMFEAEGLPDGWTSMCNDMDAIFVPSEWNKSTFLNAGVTKPIYVVPAGVASVDLPRVGAVKPSEFSFYSIFQWSERKNPVALIRAYLVAMQNKNDVTLKLKTYVDYKLPNNHAIISSHLDKIKKELKLKSYPKIDLITDYLSSEDISKIHQNSHVLLSPHRGEGWCMPAMDAMAHGNGVIATNFSGNTQFMTTDNAILLRYFKSPCFSDNPFAPFFNGNMRWAEPSMDDLIDSIKWVYENRKFLEEMGARARAHIASNFSEKTSYDAIMTALKLQQ